MNYNKILFAGLSIMFLLTSLRLHSQERNIGLTIEPQVGFLIAHRAVMGHLIEHHTYGAEFGIVLQTDGEKQWHHDFNFPEISFNAFYNNPGNEEILGHAMGIAGGIYLPFYRKMGWSFGAKLESGLSYVTKRYNIVENPKNNAIGSHLNSMVRLGFRFEKQFLHQALGFNVSMTHISNGAIKLPNLGLNMPFLGVHYSYYIQPLHFKDTAHIKREGEKINSWKFYTQLMISTKQVYPTGGRNYGVIGLTNYVHYKAGNKCIIEGGVDVIYNQSIIKDVEEEYGPEKNLQVGAYAAYVLPIHRFHVFAGMGVYIYNPVSPNGLLYHRFGARFRVIKRLWANISIKSHWGKADYFEYGLAFRW